jgi:hypothetical protein
LKDLVEGRTPVIPFPRFMILYFALDFDAEFVRAADNE